MARSSFRGDAQDAQAQAKTEIDAVRSDSRKELEAARAYALSARADAKRTEACGCATANQGSGGDGLQTGRRSSNVPAVGGSLGGALIRGGKRS